MSSESLLYAGRHTRRAVEVNGLPTWTVVKNSPARAGDVGSIPGDLEEKMTTSSSILAGNPMDRGAWQAAVHGVSKSQT